MNGQDGACGNQSRSVSEVRTALNERWKAGDRFYLALIDPLLNKPAYFALRRPNVSVGLLPGCDWTLPWSAMGIDVIADSKKFDPSYGFNCCNYVDNDVNLCLPRIGHRENEPMFRLVFDPDSGWTAKSAGVNGCRVARVYKLGTHRRVTFWHPGDMLRNCGIPLDDGFTFTFQWPHASVARNDRGHGIPAQEFRFVFIACKDGDFPLAHHLNNGPPTFLSLPTEVLARIGSYLSPEEYFSTLAMVGRVFTSPKLKKQIPWTSITLDSSFDSFRAVEMASVETLKSVRCLDVWDKVGKAGFYAKWRPVIIHEKLTILDLEDPVVLRQIGVPPNLKELRLWMRVPREGFWAPIEHLLFPVSMTHVAVRYGFRTATNTRAEPEYDRIRASRLSPKWLFATFPRLLKLHFHNVLFRDDEWSDVPDENLREVTHVYSKPLSRHLPVGRMPKLSSLVAELGLHHLEWLNDDARRSCESLKSLVVEFRDAVPFMPRLWHGVAPNLRFLRVAPFFLYECHIRDLALNFPLLEYLYIERATISLADLQSLLESLPELKDLEITSTPEKPIETASGLSAASFPEYPGALVRWSWTSSGDKMRPTFNFVFSRATSAERERAQKFFLRGILLNA